MPDDFDYSQPVSRNRVANGSAPLFTMTLIAISVVLTAVYLIAPHDDKSNSLAKVVNLVLLDSDQIWNGSLFGLFTSFFIHLNLMHIAFNMYWIWKMGTVLETTIPLWKYVLFVVVATMVGSCCELFLSGQTGAGASGAAYALMGLLWGGRGFHDSWRKLATRENMQLFLVWGVLCIFLTVSKIMPIANGAHFGGLLFGLAVGSLCFAPRRKPIWSAALVFLLGICVVSLTWLPWTSSWNWHKGMQSHRRRHYREAIAYYERGLRTGGERAGLLNNIALCWFDIADEERANNQVDAALAATEKAEAILAASKAEPPPTSAPPGDSIGRTPDPSTGGPNRNGPPSK